MMMETGLVLYPGAQPAAVLRLTDLWFCRPANSTNNWTDTIEAHRRNCGFDQ